MTGEELGTAFSRSPLSLWSLGSRCQGGAFQREVEGRRGDSHDSAEATPSSKCAAGTVKAKAEHISWEAHSSFLHSWLWCDLPDSLSEAPMVLKPPVPYMKALPLGMHLAAPFPD